MKTWEPAGGGACRVASLNATNGEFLWDYVTDHLIWNFLPIFIDDGESFIFQDSAGGVYRLGLDGREIWKVSNNEQWYETWTDGGVSIGPNGVAYAMKSTGPQHQGGAFGPRIPGYIRAYRIADGKFLWQSPQTSEPPNSWPVVGRMRKDDPLTVMAPIGTAGPPKPFNELFGMAGSLWQTPLAQIMAPAAGYLLRFTEWLGEWGQIIWRNRDLQQEVWFLDAETGKVLWKFLPPAWKWPAFRGDSLHMGFTGRGCDPNPCGNPTMDAAGTFYIGFADGYIYALEREGGGVKVASKYDAEMAFSNGGSVVAPGMFAIISCDTLFVFKS